MPDDARLLRMRSRGVVMALAMLAILAALLEAAPLLEDVSAQSNLGESLRIITPWAGNATGDLRLIDLDGDGIDEILVGGHSISCTGDKNQISVFRLDSSTKKYVHLNYGRNYVFFDLFFYAFNFEALRRSGSFLPDIIACQGDVNVLAVLDNHGGLNFSISSIAFTSKVSCIPEGTAFAVTDVDNDDTDEVFSTSKNGTNFFTRLWNTTLVSAAGIPLLLPLLQDPTASFADLDGDSLEDLFWTGKLNDSLFPTYIFRNLGGNFSSVSNSISGVRFGSLAIAEFTGDDRHDIVLSGQLANASGLLDLYENNGSMVFVRRPNPGLYVDRSTSFSVAAIPLRSQEYGLDLVAVSTGLSTTLSNISLFLNDGAGHFTPSEAGWLPASFRGKVVRGPDIGANLSFLAMGITHHFPFDGSTILGYFDDLPISYANVLFLELARYYVINQGVVTTGDFNYDNCTDAIATGLSVAYEAGGISLDSLITVMLVGDCAGSFTPSTLVLPFSARRCAGVLRDFDLDGQLDFFVSGFDLVGVGEKFYYRFDSGGLPNNLSSYLPSVPGLCFSAVCSGATGGTLHEDIYLTGRTSVNSTSLTAYFFRNARNGSFLLATSDLHGNVPLWHPACAFGSESSTDSSMMWMDIYSVGNPFSLTVFNFLKNNRNGTFTNLAASSASFPGGVPSGCELPSIVVTDLNGDGLNDLFYNGLKNAATEIPISKLYIRDANGSMLASTGLDATGALSRLYASSTAAVDIDSDSDVDLIIGGGTSEYGKSFFALLNDGSGNFSDGTSEVLGQVPGFVFGSLAIGQFTNDLKPDLINIGLGFFCGPRIFVQRENISFTTTLHSNVSLSSGSPSSGNIGALIGGLGGGLGFLLLLLLCSCCCVLVLLCCCCAVCIGILVAVIAVAMFSVIVVLAGLFAVGDIGAIVFLLRGRKKDRVNAEPSEVDTAALLVDAKRTNEYRVIPWSEIRTVKKLGSGAYGEVVLAEWNGVAVAVKLFRNPMKNVVEDFQHEALMMAKISHHPHVVNFIGASFPPNGVAIVLGFCEGGSLLIALEKKILRAADKTRVLGEVASALSFLHSLGIVHRDVAARNVLLDGAGRAKLADLGLSRLLEDKQNEQTTNSSLGPVRWMAPEAIRDRCYSSASDAFSFGVLMAEVWSDGAPPYADLKSVADVAIAVTQQGARPQIAPSTPAAQADFMRRLFAAEPEQRPPMEALHRALHSIESGSSDTDDADGGSNSGEYVYASDLH